MDSSVQRKQRQTGIELRLGGTARGSGVARECRSALATPNGNDEAQDALGPGENGDYEFAGSQSFSETRIPEGLDAGLRFRGKKVDEARDGVRRPVATTFPIQRLNLLCGFTRTKLSALH